MILSIKFMTLCRPKGFIDILQVLIEYHCRETSPVGSIGYLSADSLGNRPLHYDLHSMWTLSVSSIDRKQDEDSTNHEYIYL